jgi:Putative metal-binding motif
MSMFKLVLSLALSLVLACSSDNKPVTEALVVVDSDLTGGTDLSKVRVRVYESANDSLLTDHTLTVVARKGRANAFTLPLSFSLTPGRLGNNAQFRIAVTGRGNDENGELVDRVEKQVTSRFRAGTRTLVRVDLESGCLDVLCRDDDESAAPGGLTCVEGECAEVPAIKPEPAGSGELGGYDSARGGTDGPREHACQIDDDCTAQLGTLTPEGCAVGRCQDGVCAFVGQDADGDGHDTDTCASDSVDIALGDDCDDRNPKRSPGAWDGPAVPDEHPDTCDELDNDCDGVVDDERPSGKTCECDPINDIDVPCSQTEDGTMIAWPAGTPVGICRYGRRSCTKDGVWDTCVGAVEPGQADSCDIADDDSDCDGQRNENCPCVTGNEQPCGTDVGNCKTGRQLCSAGKWGSCSGQIAAKNKDSCDPADDANCNGTPNEGCECITGNSTTCKDAANSLGVCATRRVSCRDGKWDRSVCEPTQAEQCADDGKDEDCDGAVNERPDCECTSGRMVSCASRGALGTCALGSIPCTNGKLGVCDTPPAASDSCDQFNDDNCNGVFHDKCACYVGQQMRCSVNGCAGTQTCGSDGVWGACSVAGGCLDAGP